MLWVPLQENYYTTDKRIREKNRKNDGGEGERE